MKKTSEAKKKKDSKAKAKTVRTIPKNSPRMGNTKAIVRTSPIHGRGVVARVDGNAGGNFARYMNHSCEPNCEAETVEGTAGTRVYINALHDIAVGEELTYNYGLTLDERHTKKLKRQFACHCGSAGCRGTMLSPKR